MPRIARVIVPSQPHHIAHLGNNRQTISFLDGYRQAHIDRLRDQCDWFDVARQLLPHVQSRALGADAADRLAQAGNRREN